MFAYQPINGSITTKGCHESNIQWNPKYSCLSKAVSSVSQRPWNNKAGVPSAARPGLQGALRGPIISLMYFKSIHASIFFERLILFRVVVDGEGVGGGGQDALKHTMTRGSHFKDQLGTYVFVVLARTIVSLGFFFRTSAELLRPSCHSLLFLDSEKAAAGATMLCPTHTWEKLENIVCFLLRTPRFIPSIPLIRIEEVGGESNFL